MGADHLHTHCPPPTVPSLHHLLLAHFPATTQPSNRFKDLKEMENDNRDETVNKEKIYEKERYVVFIIFLDSQAN